MTADPSLEIQKAIRDKLVTISGVKTYDLVPEIGAVFPYVVIGEDDILADYEAGDFSECYITLHVFTQSDKAGRTSVGKVQLKTIAGQIRELLDGPLTLPSFDARNFRSFENAHFLPPEPDGKTQHAVMEFMWKVQAKPE